MPAIVPRKLRLPPKDSLVWLTAVPVVLLAVGSLVLWLLRVPGGDDPAHAYKLLLLHDGASAVWDNYWYGGSTGAVTYGIVYYWVARWVPGVVIVALSGGLLPVLFHLYMRRVWAVTSPAPAWLLAGVLVVYLAMGQSPFLMALCLVMAGLVLFSRGHPLVAAIPWSIAVFTNPLAIVVGGVFVLGDLIAHPCSRRSACWLALGLLPAIAGRGALALLFPEPEFEFHGLSQLLRLLAFAAVGVFFARRSTIPSRRALQWLFAAYAIVVLPFFLVPGMPIGSNVGRFFYVFGASLLLAAAWPSRLPRWAPVLAVVAVLCVQLPPATGHFTNVRDLPATRATFYAPALAEARKLYDPNYRFHVVTPQRHWEAYYFPSAGYAITRGWYRQADALHNLKLYDVSLTEADYVSWLQSMGVRYIFLPHAPLVSSTRHEADLLEHGSEFTIVYRDALWTIYELRDSRPIVEPLSSTGMADVLALEHTSIRFRVSQAGTYRIKLTWSPYWLLTRASGAAPLGADGPRLQPDSEAAAAAAGRRLLRRDDDRFIVFSAPSAGVYVLRFDAASALAARISD